MNPVLGCFAWPVSLKITPAFGGNYYYSYSADEEIEAEKKDATASNHTAWTSHKQNMHPGLDTTPDFLTPKPREWLTYSLIPTLPIFPLTLTPMKLKATERGCLSLPAVPVRDG